MIELVKVTNGFASAYSREQFRGDYHTTGTSDSIMNPHGVYRVDNLPAPQVDFGFKAVAWGFPRLVNGFWTAGWDVEELLIADKRILMVCSRQQGKLALGQEEWTKVLSLLDHEETPWGLRVAISDTTVWNRTDEDMAALVWAMNMSDEEADSMFILAMTL